MRGGERPRGSEGELSRIRLGIGNQLSDGIDRRRNAHRDTGYRRDRGDDGRKVGARINRRVLRQQRGKHHVRPDSKQDGIPVGRRLHDIAIADRARGTGPVIDDHRLPEKSAELGAEKTTHEVGAAAGWLRNDHPDRLGGIGLRSHATG